jgi:hypothetical protein
VAVDIGGVKGEGLAGLGGFCEGVVFENLLSNIYACNIKG